MLLAANPTRMHLLRLKKRLKLAIRGHKLLKDKQDELMRRFMDLVKQIQGLRQEVERDLHRAFERFTMARSVMSRASVEEALALPGKRLDVGVTTQRIMNVEVPLFEPRAEGRIYCYGFANTSGELDVSLRSLDAVLLRLLELAQTEKTIMLLADEIDRTRRRVNALEYTLIPSLKETIRFITMKLEELERSNLTRLMKIKEMAEER
ncbi:MAG: V-type ATP synthase subunit D [Gemmatimonadota bacterium]|nr:MAG: V-type ATP synthase subunit D [Gemmatimonadota bacterium]